jgi:hypothetical protein
VKFKRPEKSPSLDIRFSNGILEIPQLKIFDQTEILFRNLQAFEQCHGRNAHTFINDYIYFISCVVCAPNDVEVLVNNGNLTNMLSSNQAVSDLFKSPSKENLYSTNNFSLGCLQRTEFTLQKALAQVEGNLEAGLFQQSMDWYLCCCCFFNFSLF